MRLHFAYNNGFAESIIAYRSAVANLILQEYRYSAVVHKPRIFVTKKTQNEVQVHLCVRSLCDQTTN